MNRIEQDRQERSPRRQSPPALATGETSNACSFAYFLRRWTWTGRTMVGSCRKLRCVHWSLRTVWCNILRDCAAPCLSMSLLFLTSATRGVTTLRSTQFAHGAPDLAAIPPRVRTLVSTCDTHPPRSAHSAPLTSLAQQLQSDGCQNTPCAAWLPQSRLLPHRCR
jgi:hypothetical protein